MTFSCSYRSREKELRDEMELLQAKMDSIKMEQNILEENIKQLNNNQ
jgi:cell division protein FtsB